MEKLIYVRSDGLEEVFLKTATQVKELLEKGSLISGIYLGYPDPVGPFVVEIAYYEKEIQWVGSKVSP